MGRFGLGYQSSVEKLITMSLQTHVLVVAVAGLVAIGVAHNLARCVRKGIPDGETAPVCIHAPLDLVRRGRCCA